MSLFNNKKGKSEKFAKVIKGKSKKEVRKAEEKLLKPEELKAYDGEKPKYQNELASRTALIVFKNKAQQDLISEVFSVRTSSSGVTYITDISLLHNIAKIVKKGGAHIDNSGNIISNNTSDEGTSCIHSMRELQEKYFPEDVGKRCFECGRKLKKETKYTDISNKVTAYIQKAYEEVMEKPKEKPKEKKVTVKTKQIKRRRRKLK
jgi:hypothetical protein